MCLSNTIRGDVICLDYNINNNKKEHEKTALMTRGGLRSILNALIIWPSLQFSAFKKKLNICFVKQHALLFAIVEFVQFVNAKNHLCYLQMTIE